MLAKDLMKNSPATEISLTGYKVVSKGDAALGDHGYDLTAEEGTSWGFVAKDKDPKSFSSGNAIHCTPISHGCGGATGMRSMPN